MLGGLWLKPGGRAVGSATLAFDGSSHVDWLASDGYSDRLSQVVLAVSSNKSETKAPSQDERDRAAAILETHRQPGQLEQGIERLLQFVRRYPNYERFQVLVARLLEAHRDLQVAAVWRGIDLRFPQSSEAFRLVLRWAQRDFGYDRAQQILNQRYPEQPSDPSDLVNYARACEELRNFAEADDAYSRIEQLETSKLSHYNAVAMAIRKRNEFNRALTVVERAQERFGRSERLTQLAKELNREIDNVRIAVPNLRLGDDRQIGSAVLDRVLTELVDQRRLQNSRPLDAIGSLVMMSATLGCGGAERQFTHTAVGLQSHINTFEPISGFDAVGPVNVICRSLRSRPDADFFLKDIEDHDIPVMEYVDFPDFGGNVRESAAKKLATLLQYMPYPIAESARKVTDVLTGIRPDILHIWQDGAVLANCIAALLSGAPRIVLSVRSVPPIDRPERNRYDYALVYRALMSAPGISIASNSAMVARRYTEWLELDPSRVAVIHNGSRELPTEPVAGARSIYDAFDAQTGGQGFTVGTVIRFDENKRPFLWLDAAAKLLSQNPQSRFIMIGDGPLLQPSREYAERLGIAKQVLFPGRSDCIGYWLTKMDVFLLLSRFEGLPNVLIEAQFAGLPVVTTDAGGARETFRPGHTGSHLANDVTPEPEAICAALTSWQRDEAGRAEVAIAAKQWANETFSFDAMLRKTAALYMNSV
jgi:glycosyltransferase involved in cell wall biosynthesis